MSLKSNTASDQRPSFIGRNQESKVNGPLIIAAAPIEKRALESDICRECKIIHSITEFQGMCSTLDCGKCRKRVLWNGEYYPYVHVDPCCETQWCNECVREAGFEPEDVPLFQCHCHGPAMGWTPEEAEEAFSVEQ